MTDVIADRRPEEQVVEEQPLDVPTLTHPTEPSRLALAMTVSAVTSSFIVFVVLSLVSRGDLVVHALVVTAGLVVVWLALQLWRVRLLADGVKVDHLTMPQVADVVDDVRERLDYRRRVDVFVVDRLARLVPGETRTTSLTSFFGVRVILLEGGVLGDLDDEAERRRLTFVVATHLGALKARHAHWTTLLLLLDTVKLTVIVWPFVTPWLRATVYTGDRIAYACCGDLSVSAQAAYRALVGGEAVSQLRGPGLVEQALAVRRSRLLRFAQLLRATPHVPNRYLELLTFAAAHQPVSYEAVRAELTGPGERVDALVAARRSPRRRSRHLMPVTAGISSGCLVAAVAAGSIWPTESVRWMATTLEAWGWTVEDQPADEQGSLATILPSELAGDCTAADPTAYGTGASAAFACAPGAYSTSIAYVEYPDAATAAADFESQVPALPTTGECARGEPSRTTWRDGAGRTAGELACFQLDDGRSALMWSSVEHRTISFSVSERSPRSHFAWWLELPQLG